VSNENYGRWMSAFREDTTGEQHSFDDLASGLAGGTISRRRALKLAGASLLGASGLAWFASPAEAAAMCPRRGAGCARRCRNTNKTCFCIRTASGKRRCVHPCCSTRTCTSGGQCRRGEVCLKSDCCGGSVCVTLCMEPRPSYCETTSATAASSAAWN
jgi:hypothetical protein